MMILKAKWETGGAVERETNKRLSTIMKVSLMALAFPRKRIINPSKTIKNDNSGGNECRYT